jgi:hypothetical protein
VKKIQKPKILLLDIETGPAKAYIWSLFDTYTPLERLIEPGRMLCFAAKWVGEKHMHFHAEWTRGREYMLVWLKDLIDEADAVVTYNGDKFDILKIRGELIANRLQPMAPITSIDLYKVCKKLGWISGKLEYVGPFLGIGAKTKHAGFKLWRDVLDGCPKARAKMEKYNKQDVKLLEKLYKRLRPYMDKHPALRSGIECKNCGSKHVQHRGYRYTKTTKTERVQCQRCGKWDSGKRTKV